ncbi:hypothetical protein KKA14_14030 [bacterium]|nr:hypothetical protein [bacterium]
MKARLIVLQTVFVFLFCSAFSSSVFAEIELNIGLMHFPPFSDISDLENPKGVFIDMMLTSLDKAGIPHSKVKGYPPKRHYTFLGDGTTSFSIASKGVPYYDKSVIFSEKPVMAVKCLVMSLPDQPLPPANPKEWTGKFIVITGYSYGTLRESLEQLEKAGRLSLLDAPAHENLFKMLQAKRGQYALDYEGPTDKALKVVSIPGIQKRPLFSIDVFFTLHKDIPNAKDLMARIEKAYQELDAQGKFKL